MSPGGLTSGATAVSVELIAVSVLDEAVVDVVSVLAVVPASFAVQATPKTTSIGKSDRICAGWGLNGQTVAFLVRRARLAKKLTFTLHETYSDRREGY